MKDPSAELELRARLSFEQQQPLRLFRSCKVAEQDGEVVVRIDSHDKRFPDRKPTPYQVFRFDSDSGSLSLLSSEHAAPFTMDPGALMHATVGQQFPVSEWLTGFVEAACHSGAVVTLALVSGNVRTHVGTLTVLFPPAREDWSSRQVRMHLSIRTDYHQYEFLRELRRSAFRSLGIAADATWSMVVSPLSIIEAFSDPPDDIIELSS